MKNINQSLTFLAGIRTLCVISAIMLTGCSEIPTPRPRGYIRIDLPEKNYATFDSTFPYRFDYPTYSQIKPDTSKSALPYWLNIDFGKLKATLYLSYKPIKGNTLATYLEDNHLFLSRHIPKASGIEEMVVENKVSRVFGMIYNVTGTGTASPVQFYLTDSSNHFIRGALYFNFRPNNDSLRPVIDFLSQDIIHLAETFRWK